VLDSMLEPPCAANDGQELLGPRSLNLIYPSCFQKERLLFLRIGRTGKTKTLGHSMFYKFKNPGHP
jgi:hypothetical protein